MRKEQELGEIRLARARLWVTATATLAALIYLFIAPGAEFDEHFRTCLLMAGGLVYSYGWLLYIKTHRFRQFHPYISSSLDMGMVVLMHLVWSVYPEANDVAAQLHFTAGYGSLLALIILTGMRFDYRPLIYVTSIVLVFYSAYIAYAWWTGNYKFTTSWSEGFLNPATFHIRDLTSRLLIILIAGTLMSYLVRRVGKLLKISVATTIQKEQLRQFVSTGVATEIESGRASLDLTGHRQVVTIMFCDIQGFTRMSEKMPPEELLTLLNRYYETMAEEIFEHRGTLDKYLGDGIMALFGAPTKLDNSSLTGVECALAMLNKIDEFNQRYGYRVSIGIGLHTAQVLVGNLGTPAYKNYTAIGDGVNIASRIESATRESGRPLLFSGEVKKHLGRKYSIRSLGRFQLKGKKASRVLYTIDDE